MVRVRDAAEGEVGKSVRSSERGEYWKLLLPGQYTVRSVYSLLSKRDSKQPPRGHRLTYLVVNT